jgi:F-type H+-transporting ATPase subunit delta
MAAVASRYARALTDVIFSAKLDAAKTVQDLKDMNATLHSSKELRFAWESPAIPQEKKLKLLDKVAGQAGLAKQVRNFIAILIDQRRLNLLPEMIAQVQAQVNERLGFADAEVMSSRLLADDERRSLESHLAKATGKTVRASYAQDKALLGGAVIKVGSTIYDGSVRGRLQRMKQQIAGDL